jgi:hypothetical protein
MERQVNAKEPMLSLYLVREGIDDGREVWKGSTHLELPEYEDLPSFVRTVLPTKPLLVKLETEDGTRVQKDAQGLLRWTHPLRLYQVLNSFFTWTSEERPRMEDTAVLNFLWSLGWKGPDTRVVLYWKSI